MMNANAAARTDPDVLKAIFKIVATGKVGTGFLVHDQQHILTAFHVVNKVEAEKVTVLDLSANVSYQATIQKTIEALDIALLRLDEPIEDVLPLNLSSQAVASGTIFRTFGFPTSFGGDFHWYFGEILGEMNDRTYDIAFKDAIPDSLSGLSGGPVFRVEDATCLVVGIVVKQSPALLQKGRVVPSESFFEDITQILHETTPEPMPWCYVVLSEAEAITSSPYKLEDAVHDALEILQRGSPSFEKELKNTQFVRATTVVSSPEAYENAVAKLCHAKIVIFDVTHFEPVVMLLLGIRSVVRRGITIASRGGNSVTGEVIDFPFNIKEVNIISHSQKQHERPKTPPKLIRDEIQEGLRQLQDMPQYLDLPTFDVIRNLPPKSREPDALNILVLCPYNERYQANNWKWLLTYMQMYVPEGAAIQRNMDVPSPLLISHTLYQAIRRKVLCIADWTEWRPNVFFELGVRLAITSSRRFTVSILEGRHEQLIQKVYQQRKELAKDDTAFNALIATHTQCDTEDITKEKRERYLCIAEQCMHLFKLFEPLVYNGSPFDEEYPLMKAVFKEMVYYYKHETIQNTPADKKGLAPYFTYNVIQEHIDPDEETISLPVYIELLRTANLFDVDDTDGRKAVLYPEKEALTQRVETGIVQRLLAAWYFIRKEYTDSDILSDEMLRINALNVSLKLRSHISNDEKRSNLSKEIDDFIDLLEKEE